MNLMNNTISAFSVAAALTIASMSGGCVILADDDSSLTIANESSYTFVDLAVRGVGDIDFSDNLLRSGPLFPGQDITVLLDCGDYDVFVEDDAQGQCTIAVDLCFDDAFGLLTISNSTAASLAPLHRRFRWTAPRSPSARPT